MIASSGVFFIMTMGGLDFSQGSILGMASLAVCYLSKTSMILAVIGGIVVGAAVGAINGYFYVNRKIKGIDEEPILSYFDDIQAEMAEAVKNGEE